MDYIELLRSFGEGHGPDGILRTTTGILPVLGGTPQDECVLKKISLSRRDLPVISALVSIRQIQVDPRPYGVDRQRPFVQKGLQDPEVRVGNSRLLESSIQKVAHGLVGFPPNEPTMDV